MDGNKKKKTNTVVVAQTDFTKANPETITKLLKAHAEAVDFINFSQNTPPSRNVVSREGMNANPIILPVLIC